MRICLSEQWHEVERLDDAGRIRERLRGIGEARGQVLQADDRLRGHRRGWAERDECAEAGVSEPKRGRDHRANTQRAKRRPVERPAADEVAGHERVSAPADRSTDIDVMGGTFAQGELQALRDARGRIRCGGGQDNALVSQQRESRAGLPQAVGDRGDERLVAARHVAGRQPSFQPSGVVLVEGDHRLEPPLRLTLARGAAEQYRSERRGGRLSSSFQTFGDLGDSRCARLSRGGTCQGALDRVRRDRGLTHVSNYTNDCRVRLSGRDLFHHQDYTGVPPTHGRARDLARDRPPGMKPDVHADRWRAAAGRHRLVDQVAEPFNRQAEIQPQQRLVAHLGRFQSPQ